MAELLKQTMPARVMSDAIAEITSVPFKKYKPRDITIDELFTGKHEFPKIKFAYNWFKKFVTSRASFIQPIGGSLYYTGRTTIDDVCFIHSDEFDSPRYTCGISSHPTTPAGTIAYINFNEKYDNIYAGDVIEEQDGEFIMKQGLDLPDGASIIYAKSGQIMKLEANDEHSCGPFPYGICRLLFYAGGD